MSRFLSQMPRFGSKIRWLVWVERPGFDGALLDEQATGTRDSSTLGTHEGEGMTEASHRRAEFRPSSPADTSQDQHRSDYIPKAEALLRTMWLPLHLPHRILTR